MNQTKPEFRVWDKTKNLMIYPKKNDTFWIDLSGNIMAIDRNAEPLNKDEFILLQYTGLKDNTHWSLLTKKEKQDWISNDGTNQTWKGKKIYEGDIVKTNAEIHPNCEVIFMQGVFGLVDGNGRHHSLRGFSRTGSSLIEITIPLEVIGNRFENKNLSKGN